MKPPSTLTVSEWADKYRVLSRGPSAEPGKWNTARAPYQRAIMDALTMPGIESVVVMGSAQFGKSEIIINALCYFIDQDPASVLLVQPTIETAKDFSKDRLTRAFEDTPRLRGLVKEAKTRDSDNTILHKNFPGGSLSLAGANSPASLAGKPIRFLCMDDIDRFKGVSGREGDSVSLAEKRTTTFFNRLHLYCSTPTIKGLSKIEELYEGSDKRKLWVKCPECHGQQILSFWNLIYDKEKFNKNNKPKDKDIEYKCALCGVLLPAIKARAFFSRAENLEWRAEKEFKGIAGFWLNQLYSTLVSWSYTVGEYLDAKEDPEKLKVFINTVLGESYEERGEAPAWERLFIRREKYQKNIIPKGGLLLIAGADVQQNRVEMEIVAYGRDKESWSVDYRIFPGDPAGKEIWQRIALIFDERFKTESGKIMALRRLAIDTGGHWTNEVYSFGRQLGSDRVMLVKGTDRLTTILGRPNRLDFTADGKRISGGINLWPIGVSRAKTELYSYLRLNPPATKEENYPAGYCHFPEYEEEFFQQLTAEDLVRRKTKQGHYHYEYVKNRQRNEALDCRVYARACAESLGMDRFSEKHWQFLEDQQIDFDIYIDMIKGKDKITTNKLINKGRRILSRGL